MGNRSLGLGYWSLLSPSHSFSPPLSPSLSLSFTAPSVLSLVLSRLLFSSPFFFIYFFGYFTNYPFWGTTIYKLPTPLFENSYKLPPKRNENIQTTPAQNDYSNPPLRGVGEYSWMHSDPDTCKMSSVEALCIFSLPQMR